MFTLVSHFVASRSVIFTLVSHSVASRSIIYQNQRCHNYNTFAYHDDNGNRKQFHRCTHEFPGSYRNNLIPHGTPLLRDTTEGDAGQTGILRYLGFQ